MKVRLKARRAASRRQRFTTLRLGGEEPAPPQRLLSPQASVTHTDIRLPRLPETFDGLKIVLLTDLHHSLLTPIEDVDHAVRLANRQRPDLVALTGDYVTLSPEYIGPVARALGNLRARLGVFAVLGNHDFNVDADGMARALEAQSIHVLRDSSWALKSGSNRLWLLGVDDFWWGGGRPERALRQVPQDELKILLCHNPVGIFWAAARQIDLVLSGHTHGGQVRLPVVGGYLSRPKFGKQFVEGWNRLNGTQIYVSRGIGKIILPFRVGCPPEVALLRLRKSQDG